MEGEMAQGRERQPFEMPFTFSLKNTLFIVADYLSKKALLAIYQHASRLPCSQPSSENFGRILGSTVNFGPGPYHVTHLTQCLMSSKIKGNVCTGMNVKILGLFRTHHHKYSLDRPFCISRQGAFPLL
jgi:hypothetical protein